MSVVILYLRQARIVKHGTSDLDIGNRIELAVGTIYQERGE